ncbi:MAG: hypothetical protein DRP37_02645, partial [Thermodesulfobacteriota bacterium]
LTKTVISSKARNLIVLKIQALKISPYGRNDKKRGFRSDTIYINRAESVNHNFKHPGEIVYEFYRASFSSL